MKRVSSKGDDYCSDHTGMDEKHVDKTPAKERKIAIPGVAKSKETQKVEAPKLKPRSLLPSLVTDCKHRAMYYDLHGVWHRANFKCVWCGVEMHRLLDGGWHIGDL